MQYFSFRILKGRIFNSQLLSFTEIEHQHMINRRRHLTQSSVVRCVYEYLTDGAVRLFAIAIAMKDVNQDGGHPYCASTSKDELLILYDLLLI
jgi:hypothetical protein